MNPEIEVRLRIVQILMENGIHPEQVLKYGNEIFKWVVDPPPYTIMQLRGDEYPCPLPPPIAK